MEEVFDIRTAPFSSWIGFAPVIIIGIGVLFEIARRHRALRTIARDGTSDVRPIALLACAVVLMINGVMILGYRREKQELIEALDSGRARVIEGTISDYRRQSGSPKRMESFQLEGVRFSFDGYGTTPAYHRRASTDGKLRDGVRLRLWEYRGNILRLEILDSLATPTK